MSYDRSYDFDTAPARHGSDSLKWAKYAGRQSTQGEDILPLWVADMDFASAPDIMAALQARIAHGVFGYGHTTTAFSDAILMALQRDYDWTVQAEWIVPLPGLVAGLNSAARAIGQRGDTLVTATPVYPALFTAPVHMERHCQRLPLAEDRGWCWDMEALAATHTATTKGLFLCHPHNPLGRIWRDAELQALAAHAEKHDLIVVSDEIHCDLLLEPGRRHKPFALVAPAMAGRSITLMAPSKTYNIPGLGAAFAIIPDASLRRRYLAAMAGIVPHPNILGMVACEAAYRHGAPWRSALIAYLRRNRDQVMGLHGLRGLKVIKPEATYLAWIDCRASGLENPVAFFEAAGVGLSDGADFGAPGFVRLNFGCPGARLHTALQRMRTALQA